MDEIWMAWRQGNKETALSVRTYGKLLY